MGIFKKRNTFDVIYEGGDLHKKVYGSYPTLEEAIKGYEEAVKNGEEEKCGMLWIRDPDGNEVEF